MSDAQGAPAPVPAAPAAPVAAPSLSDQLWGALAKFYGKWLDPLLGPVVSLVKVRSWWVYGLFALLAWYVVSIRGELKATLLSSIITLGTCFFGYVIGKIVSPEIKVGEQLADVKAGNQGAALIVVAAIAQRVVYGALCFIGAIYMIPSIADKIR